MTVKTLVYINGTIDVNSYRIKWYDMYKTKIENQIITYYLLNMTLLIITTFSM